MFGLGIAFCQSLLDRSQSILCFRISQTSWLVRPVYLRIFLWPPAHLVWFGHLVLTWWWVTWSCCASSFLCKSILAQHSQITRRQSGHNFQTCFFVNWSKNESAFLSALVKTLSAKKTLTLQKWNLWQTISGVFWCPPPSPFRQHEKRKGCK